MGAIRYPSSTGLIPGLNGIDAGTLTRAESPSPWSAGGRAWQQFKRVLQYINPVERGRCLVAVYRQGLALAPGEVEREVPGAHEILAGVVDGLLQALLVIGLTTAVGAVAGGVIGAFFGGVGAIPGAAVGGEVGLDAGLAILTWLGVGFLIAMIVNDLGEVVSLVKSAARRGWEAAEYPVPQRQQIIARAGHDLARALAVLVRLIFQAIVAYLLHKGSGAMREQVPGLVAKLRASKFGAPLAEYVERNWRRLVEDPRFKPKTGAAGGEGKAGGGGGSPSTPTGTPNSSAPKAPEVSPLKAEAVAAETNAAQTLRQMQQQAGPKSHFYDRHGAHVTNQQLMERARTGIPPEYQSPNSPPPNFKIPKNPPDSTKFTSNQNQLDAIRQALQERARRIANPQTFANNPGKLNAFEFEMPMKPGDGPIGGGYRSRSTTLEATSRKVQVAFDPGTGTIKTIYPIFE